MAGPQQDRTLSARTGRGYGNVGASRRPGLVVNTSFSRHHGRIPQQIFPSGPDATVTNNVNEFEGRPYSAREENVKQSPRHNVPATTYAPSPARPNQQTKNIRPRQDSRTTPARPFHRRISRLRPAPLNLTRDVSSSDCAITIGLSLSPPRTSEHAAGSASMAVPHRAQYYGEKVQTPTIVVTPAKEDFDLGLSSQKSYTIHDNGSVSSLYSRYTNGMPKCADATPPIPPLPLFARNQQAPTVSRRTIDESEISGLAHDRTFSTHTAFEDNTTTRLHAPYSNRLTTWSSAIPTPRRSNGWWNFITSPFSAGSQAFFWRSPDLEDREDKERILDNSASMGHIDDVASITDNDAVSDKVEVRSAVTPTARRIRFDIPKRSETAPAALASGTTRLNIYQIPNFGLATAYYDTSRHFSSVLIERDGAEGVRNSLVGWSPSQSVARFSRGLSSHSKQAGIIEPGEVIGEGATSASEAEFEDGAVGTLEDPFADFAGYGAGKAQDHKLRKIFTTPQTEELKGGTPNPPAKERNDTQPTLASYFSPLTATPTVEEAHVATCMGPDSSHGEPREVELQSSRTPSPPALGLGVATMSSRGVAEQQLGPEQDQQDTVETRYPLQRSQWHVRNDSSGSLGLGISDGERQLLPPPAAYVEKARWMDDSDLESKKQQSEQREPWYHHFFWLIATSGAFSVFVLVILLVMLVPHAHTDMAVETEWVNLTAFPPLPTGIATVIQPSNVKTANGCVSPPSLWSCDVPSDQQAETSNGLLNQPNFRLEIRFRNGSLPSNETQLARRSGFAATAGRLTRRNDWTDSLYAAQPAAPSAEDQMFLGQYSDNVSTPYQGEETPFYITLLDPTALIGDGGHIVKRQSDPYPYPTPSNSTMNSSSSAATSIPRPALKPNGEPAETQLYPFASAQPLRLFDRDQDSEHYGFYTYFDRTLLVGNTSASVNNPAGLGLSANISLANATAVCTWSQTRLHVQIWTRKGSVTGLKDNLIPLNGLPAANSTANDMQAPGSFPFPVTVTLDRHGGTAKEKGVYCYAIDEQKKVMQNAKIWVNEDRAFGGTIVQPAQVPGSNSSESAVISRSTEQSMTYGGIDGGNGGCACQWQSHP